MTLEYTIAREEISNWYWQNWRNRFWKIHLSTFISAFVIVLVVKGAWPPGFVGIAEASLIAAGIIGAFMYYPQLMFKSQQRTLIVSDEGIETTIGRKHGRKKWLEISKIEETPEEVIITGLNGNAFLVPQRAFHSPEERANFITTLRRGNPAHGTNNSLRGPRSLPCPSCTYNVNGWLTSRGCAGRWA